MSTLSVGTIKSLTSGTPPSIKDSAGTETGQFCRAWVNFNGTGTVAIRDSFNVSSITDNGTGDYTINFTNALPTANYSVGSILQQAGIVSVSNTASPTTSTFRTQVTDTAGNPADRSTVCLTFFGD